MQDVCPLLFNQPSQASKALPACQNKTAVQSDPIRVVILDVLDPASSPKSAEKQTNWRRNLCSTWATRITSVRHCSSSQARFGRQCKPNRTNRTASIRGDEGSSHLHVLSMGQTAFPAQRAIRDIETGGERCAFLKWSKFYAFRGIGTESHIF